MEKDEHNHAPIPAKIQAKSVISEIKERAIGGQESTHQIVATATIGLAVAVQGQLPPISYLKKTFQRSRQVAVRAPANPRSLEELIIPIEYQQTAAGHPFLLRDTGPGPNRMLIFSTNQNLDMLAHSPHWFADGTFKTAPPLFEQLYTVHGIRYSSVIPLVFALLPNKSQVTYTRLLAELKDLNPNLNPTSIMTDFELSSINSFAEEFPATTRRGCFFHFTQCFWRRIQAAGLQERYSNDGDFGLQMRMLPALAFVPVPDVIASFDEVSEALPLEAQPVVDYFEDTWIGRPNRRGGRRAPLFPMELWNCHQSILDGIAKTNNSVEGWHRGFVELVGAHHPSIFKFITCLKQEQSLNETKIEQYIAGQQPPLGRRRYRDCAARIERIVNDYGNRPILDYLRGLAHNYDF